MDAGKKNSGIEKIKMSTPKNRNPPHHMPTHLLVLKEDLELEFAYSLVVLLETIRLEAIKLIL